MHSDLRRCVFLLILYCKCACVCVFTCIHEKRGGESSSGSGQVKCWRDVTVSVVPLSVPGEYSYTLLPSLSKPKAISTHRVITPYPGKRTHDITLRIHSHHRQYTVLWNSTLVQSPQDLNFWSSLSRLSGTFSHLGLMHSVRALWKQLDICFACGFNTSILDIVLWPPPSAISACLSGEPITP